MLDHFVKETPMALALRIGAPYLSVLIFWVWLENGLLALLAYHAQILFWAIQSQKPNFSISKQALGVVTPTAFCGVVTYFFLPYLVKLPVSEWLARFKVTGVTLSFLVPYFGVIHPFLEQAHWRPICQGMRLGHWFFAGYHMLVIHSLLSLPWLIISFFLLTAVSYLWSYLARKEGSYFPSTLIHICADFGMILAVWLLVS